MGLYRCVFLDEHDEAKSVEAIDVDDLNQAIGLAIDMLKMRARYRSVEVWLGGHRLYIHPNGPIEPGAASATLHPNQNRP
jgi:hypothetical protein